jgi:hypothetical protein
MYNVTTYIANDDQSSYGIESAIANNPTYVRTSVPVRTCDVASTNILAQVTKHIPGLIKHKRAWNTPSPILAIQNTLQGTVCHVSIT